MTHLLPYPGHELFAENTVRADRCDFRYDLEEVEGTTTGGNGP